MLTEVADGVWVRRSAWVWSNAIAVRGESGLILIDPGIDGSDLNQLADDLDRLGIPVVAGFSTHPHWDHLLWHSRFGDAPRYATAAAAHAAGEARARGQRMAAESASGIPLELFGLVTPLPADGGGVPGEIIEHEAHSVGHAAVLLADRGVLLAGDMLSDVLIPLLDARQPNQLGAYETALDRLGDAARHVDVVVPGHGAVAEGREVAARLAADHAYIDALRRGEEPVDARLGPDVDWLSGPHQSNLADRFVHPTTRVANSAARRPVMAVRRTFVLETALAGSILRKCSEPAGRTSGVSYRSPAKQPLTKRGAMSANAIDLRDEIVSKSRAGVGLREIEETVIERSALDEDERAALWLLAWSLPTTNQSAPPRPH